MLKPVSEFFATCQNFLILSGSFDVPSGWNMYWIRYNLQFLVGTPKYLLTLSRPFMPPFTPIWDFTIIFLVVEAVLKHFCQAVGINYQDTMINWRPISDDGMKQLQPYGKYYKTAMESTKFLPSTPKPVIDEGTADVMKNAIEEAMPYYLKFKERSVKFDA